MSLFLCPSSTLSTGLFIGSYAIMWLTEVNNILGNVNFWMWIKVSILTYQLSRSHDIYGNLVSDFKMRGSHHLGLVTWCHQILPTGFIINKKLIFSCFFGSEDLRNLATELWWLHCHSASTGSTHTLCNSHVAVSCHSWCSVWVHASRCSVLSRRSVLLWACAQTQHK